jgi:hypothetical protein
MTSIRRYCTCSECTRGSSAPTIVTRYPRLALPYGECSSLCEILLSLQSFRETDQNRKSLCLDTYYSAN